jgi:hypothetical protein
VEKVPENKQQKWWQTQTMDSVTAISRDSKPQPKGAPNEPGREHHSSTGQGMSTPNPSSSSRQPPQNGPARKHNKKKSRSSWKAGFKSTPSSPSQPNLEPRSIVMPDLSYGANMNSTSSTITNNHNILGNTPLTTNMPSRTNCSQQVQLDKEDKENVPPQTLNPMVDTSIKDSDSNNINTKITTAITGKGPSTPRKNEFLQNLDIQLIKLQREEERGQGSPTGPKDTKQASGTPNGSKPGSTKVFDHELSQLLKTPAPAVAPSGGEGSQGTLMWYA